MVINKDILQVFLKDKFPNSKIKFVGEGWDSLAFIVDNKIIRFPKEKIDAYKKEQKITNFIRDKIDIQIPEITIVEDVEYPYSIHNMLLGNNWTVENINNKAPEIRNNFIHDCAKFFTSVHKIDTNQIKQKFPGLLKIRTSKLESFEYINQNLQMFMSDKEVIDIYNKYEKTKNNDFGEVVLLHRDFSGANTLVDNNLHLTGVFDWGDVNFGERAYEFQRLYNPKYLDFLKELLNDYELQSGVHIDIERIKEISLIDRINSICWANNSASLGEIKDEEIHKLITKLKWFL